MASAEQYKQPTIRRSPTLLVREVTPAAAAAYFAVFNLPVNTVILDGGVKVRTAGTGAGTWALQHSEGPVACSATVINSTLNDTEKMTVGDTVIGKKNASAAATFGVLGAGTLTTSALLLVWVLCYREDYNLP